MRDMFEDTVERLLGDIVTPALIQESEQGRWPSSLWQAIEDNGLPIAAVSESLGGVGGTWHDAFVLVRSAGRHAAPVPLAETILVNWLLAQLGVEPVSGPATLGVSADGCLDGDRFTGTMAHVPWGRAAPNVLTIVQHPKPAILVLATRDAEATAGLNMAREPRDTLTFEGASPVVMASIAEDVPADLLLMMGATVRSAQIAGALAAVLDTAIEYANQRVQFGRAIGKFQAIQHQIAILAEQTALASAGAEGAFAACHTARIWPDLLPVAAAKSVASEAAGQGSAIAHSVLGAIGFTYEHALHLKTRRLLAWRSEFGSQADWSKRVGEASCQIGGESYWPYLTSGGTFVPSNEGA